MVIEVAVATIIVAMVITMSRSSSRRVQVAGALQSAGGLEIVTAILVTIEGSNVGLWMPQTVLERGVMEHVVQRPWLLAGTAEHSHFR